MNHYDSVIETCEKKYPEFKDKIQKRIRAYIKEFKQAKSTSSSANTRTTPSPYSKSHSETVNDSSTKTSSTNSDENKATDLYNMFLARMGITDPKIFPTYNYNPLANLNKNPSPSPNKPMHHTTPSKFPSPASSLPNKNSQDSNAKTSSNGTSSNEDSRNSKKFKPNTSSSTNLNSPNKVIFFI